MRKIKRDRCFASVEAPRRVAVYTADDLGAFWQPGPLLVPPPPIPGIVFNLRTHMPLAKDKVRYAGEPLASWSRRAATSPRTRWTILWSSWRTLPAVVDLEAALENGSASVHDDLGSNVASHVRQSKGDYRSAAAKADLVLKRRFRYEHGISSPIETRGVVAQWNARGRADDGLGHDAGAGLRPQRPCGPSSVSASGRCG